MKTLEFLAHLCYKKLEWAFLIACHMSVCPSVNFSHFLFPPKPLGQFQPNLTQSILEWRGFKLVQMKGHTFIQGEVIMKQRKLHWRNLRIFSRTFGPISTKLFTKHYCVKGTQDFEEKNSVFKKEIIIFFSHNQCYGVIINSNAQMC